MAGYKDLDFNERRAVSQKAREQAVAKLKARPPVDEPEQARRRANPEAREAAAADKREAAKQARLAAAETAKAEQARADDEAAAAASRTAELTEEERKAARDARYASRKKKAKR